MKKQITNRKRMYKRREMKRKLTVLAIIGLTVLLIMSISKGNQPKIIGYTYDSGSTVWEMAKKYCPPSVDIRDVVREIEKANGIENAIVYDYMSYKVPVYEEVK